MSPTEPATQPKQDARYLEKRHQTWLCVVAVPRPLHPILGRRLVRSLKTGDLKTAQRLRHAVVGEFQQRIAKAQSMTGPAKGLADEAMQFRAWANAMETPEGASEAAYTAADLIADRAEKIEVALGLEAARRFVKVASGAVDPITAHLEAWLAEAGYPARSRLQHRAAIAELVSWCEAEGVSADLGAISRKVAGSFASAAGAARGVMRSTVNRKMSSLRTYWRWLERKGHVSENPWLDQSLPAPRSAAEAESESKSRPFAPAEVVALLSGDAGPVLSDFIRIAALSGARCGEIASLKVQDCADGWFRIKKSKTDAGRRRVPIHDALQEIFARRTKDKEPGDWLFTEFRTDKQGERSTYVSKRFTTYRKAQGVHSANHGQRRSAVTFHSWRNWFITEAIRAGQPADVVGQVVGHARQGVTMGVYFGGFDERALRACVAAVQLPCLDAASVAP